MTFRGDCLKSKKLHTFYGKYVLAMNIMIITAGYVQICRLLFEKITGTLKRSKKNFCQISITRKSTCNLHDLVT